MVTVIYMRGGRKYRALTGKILMFWIGVALIERVKSHVHDKRQASDSNGLFLRIENKKIRTVQNNSYG